ncbi:MAG TPA: helix-turn-helix transcriptional regulator [Candidatus Limnocylindrales bacterium]|nr:helix-turn-helix transcriptional regulator [Candidatus Limnocylindrales bacterium]
MAASERMVAAAGRRAHRDRVDLGQELRDARVSAGLSQIRVAASIGVSASEVGRIERGEAPWVSLDVLSKFGAAVGLDVRLRAYPGGSPLRDEAHIALLAAFRTVLNPRLSFRAEVPVSDSGDLRAWDGVVGGAGDPIGVEAEMAIRDWQRLNRRLALKLRDGSLTRIILLVADTRTNRAALAAAAPMIESAFPIQATAALTALREGRDPGGSSLIVMRVPPLAHPPHG